MQWKKTSKMLATSLCWRILNGWSRKSTGFTTREPAAKRIACASLRFRWSLTNAGIFCGSAGLCVNSDVTRSRREYALRKLSSTTKGDTGPAGASLHLKRDVKQLSAPFNEQGHRAAGFDLRHGGPQCLHARDRASIDRVDYVASFESCMD